MASLQQACPLPLHPYPQKTGNGDHKTRKNTLSGLHFHFARRLPQSYILKLLDRRLPCRICHPGRRWSRSSEVRDPWASPRGSASRGPSTPKTLREQNVFPPLRMTGLLRRSQDFIPDVFQDIQSAFYSDLSGKNGVFILDAENPLVADFHVGEHDFFPGAGTVPVAHRPEGLRGPGEITFLEREIQYAVSIEVILVEGRVFHVRVENRTLLA